MKKIIIPSIVILLVVLISAAIYIGKPYYLESMIQEEIDKANYCEVDSDCVNAGGKCPFGCWNYVNKDEVGRISSLIESFDSQCVYGCVSCPTAVCENNKCREVCEEPQGNASAEANLGESCSADEECALPFDYAVRSNCPFESNCIDDACKIVCPLGFQEIPNEEVSCNTDADCDCSVRGDATIACRCHEGACVSVEAE
ncbi:MAG: hypothetical protein ACOC32_01335 [Nanoarchaeota archaeon]